MNFHISAATDIGTKRKKNQDSLFVRKLMTKTGGMVFAALCDGMGGLSRGELASAALIVAFTDWMYQELPVLSQEPLEDYIIRNQWSALILSKNNRIRCYGKQNGGAIGSTATVLLLTEYRYYILNIGDSRVYEIGEPARQITEDHTVAASEVRRGLLTEEQADHSPDQNVLTRCVGVQEEVYPDFFFGDVRKDTVYLLCSDGFRHRTGMEEMKEYLWLPIRKDLSAMRHQEEYLIELNKQRGETDNISVITIYTEES